jgi:DNA-directed RNA polymerase specialized sigma24 family protein
MRFIDDSSYEEIAAALKKSQGAIRVTLHRALKKIRAIMEEGSENA